MSNLSIGKTKVKSNFFFMLEGCASCFHKGKELTKVEKRYLHTVRSIAKFQPAKLFSHIVG